MEHHEVRVGKQYTCTERPGIWVAIKKNPVNIKLRNTETRTILNAHPSFLREHDPSSPAPPVSYVPPTVQHFDREFTLGTVIAFTEARMVSKFPGFYVVIGMTGNTKARVAKLGGDGGRYVRNITPSTEFIIVNPRDLLIQQP